MDKIQAPEITKELLENYNQNYSGSIGDAEIAQAQALQYAVHRSRMPHLPRPGDYLRIDGKLVHVDRVDNDEVSLCHGAMVPFIDARLGSRCMVSLNTSGGPWELVSYAGSTIKRVGQHVRSFTQFCGLPRANGALDFPAVVNVFELTK